jgi:hypothetical protein
MELGNAHILKLHFEASGKEFDIVQHSFIHTYIHTPSVHGRHAATKTVNYGDL